MYALEAPRMQSISRSTAKYTRPARALGSRSVAGMSSNTRLTSARVKKKKGTRLKFGGRFMLFYGLVSVA